MKRPILYLLLTALIFLLATGCKISRQKCVEKYGFTNQIVIRDTVIPIPAVRVDTFLKLQSDTVRMGYEIHDTVHIERERVRLRIIRSTDTVFAEAECLPDTVIVPTQTIQTSINANDAGWKWWDILIVIAAIFCGIVVIYHALR